MRLRQCTADIFKSSQNHLEQYARVTQKLRNLIKSNFMRSFKRTQNHGKSQGNLCMKLVKFMVKENIPNNQYLVCMNSLSYKDVKHYQNIEIK